MMTEWKTLEDVHRDIPDEESAKKYLAELRWGKFASCPYCGNTKCYMIKERSRYKCASPKCRKKFSVTVKTLLEATKIPENKWLYAFFLFSKSRGKISSFDLATSIGVAHRTEFFLRERLEFVWGRIGEKIGKSSRQIINELFLASVNGYHIFFELKNSVYSKNPYRVVDIDDISDVRQYNILLRYTRYYVTVYCDWIFLDFAKPEEILTETFLWMRDNNMIEYNAESIIKNIQGTVNRMWYRFLNEHPKYHNMMRDKGRLWKKNARINLHTSYLIEQAYSRVGNNKTRKEIRGDKKLLQEIRESIIEDRKKNSVLYDFESHFS